MLIILYFHKSCLQILYSFASCSSSRTEPPDLVGIMRVTDDMIDSLVCPPPPTDPPVMSEEMITGLIVPAPGWSKYIFCPLPSAHLHCVNTKCKYLWSGF